MHDGIFIPDILSLKTKLIQEAHDCKMASHDGQRPTLEKLRAHWFWPHMEKEVKEYVR